MPGTAVEHVESRGLDLTRAPWRQWDAEMVELMKKTVLPQAKTEAEVYFCLAMADSLGLNPFANEVYFIPQKGRDGEPGGVKPYIGREGLVKKASDRGAYFEGDVVHENDKFRVARGRDGQRTVTHSYGKQEGRGEIVGAYAFLYGSEWDTPAFFYAAIEEYLPSFDAQWKMDKSPWSDKNQRSSMMLKCAMIGAGRQRLNLSGVLIDAEVDRYMQQTARGETPSFAAGSPTDDFNFDLLPVDEMLRERLREAVAEARSIDAEAWPAAKCEMTFGGRDADELITWAERIEAENEAAKPDDDDDAIPDAEVVSPEQDQLDELRMQESQLRQDLAAAQNADQEASIRARLDGVRAQIRQLGGEAPGQEKMDLGE